MLNGTLAAGSFVIMLVLNACPALEKPDSRELPTEFVLQLGLNATIHVAAIARRLEDLGARVEIDANGSLVAVRPEA